MEVDPLPEGMIAKTFQNSLQNLNARIAALGEPSHKKYITPTADGNYDLTLDVQGDSVETVTAPVDIVIAFDVSASTTNKMIEYFQSAARKMMNVLLTQENTARDPSMQHRIAIVDFNDTPRTICSFSSDVATVSAAIDKIASRPVQTSWSRVIDYAYNLIASAGQPNSRKHLLFLTDGHPNVPTQNNESKLYPYNKAYTAALNILKKEVTLYSIAALHKNNDFNNDAAFMFYVDKTKAHPLKSPDDLGTKYSTDKWLSLEALMRNAYTDAGRTDEADGKFFTVENENQTQYETALEAIGKEISKVHVYTDITITDTLTQYVDLLNTVDGTGQITDAVVKKTDKDGVETPVANYTLTYDAAERKVVCTIDEDLEHQATYSVTLKVGASSTASSEWEYNTSSGQYPNQNGYPHVGGAGTGTSSEGKYGFHTNAEATLKYYVQSTNGEVVVGEEQTATPYEKPVIQLATYPEINDDEPMHRKFIEPNDDGTYRLRLNVLGDTKELIQPADPVDIVIIFDASKSTTPDMFKSFRAAAREMVRIFLTDENSTKEPSKQNRISIVSFAITAQQLGGKFMTDPDEVNDYIDALNHNPSEDQTSWRNGLRLGNEVLTSQGREQSRKVAVFLADAHPNNPGSSQNAYNATYNEALSMIQNGVTLYSIAALQGTNDHDDPYTTIWMFYVDKNTAHPIPSNYTFENYPGSNNWLTVEAFTRKAYMNGGRAGEANGKFWSVEKDTQKDYLDVFEEIAADISKSRTFSDIVITDTLSDYAVLENAVDASGNIQGAKVKKRDLNNVEYDIDDYTLTYDADARKITFTVNGVLEHGMMYFVEFTVSPSERAFLELAENRYTGQNAGQEGYPHTGGSGTGSASEAQAGFHSNTEATLTYHTVITSEGGSSSEQFTATPYEDPVLQLELSEIDIEKLWENDDESERPADIDIVLKRGGAVYRQATLTAGDDWKAVFTGLPGGPGLQEYTIEELQVDGYEVSYSQTRVEFTGLLGQNAHLTVTNTKMDGDLAIYKTDGSYRLGLEGAEFKLYRAADDWSIIDEVIDYQIVTHSDGYSFLYDLPFGKYILKETKAPPGYMLQQEPVRIDFVQASDLIIVVNLMQTVLPNTGGGGTLPYVLSGAALILLSLTLSLHIKRKNTQKRKDV